MQSFVQRESEVVEPGDAEAKRIVLVGPRVRDCWPLVRGCVEEPGALRRVVNLVVEPGERVVPEGRVRVAETKTTGRH